MKLELIKAERMTYGDYRYRLTVAESCGPFRWTQTYLGKVSSLNSAYSSWHHDGKMIMDGTLNDDLNALLARALVGNQCPPVCV